MKARHLILLVLFLCLIAVPATADELPQPPVPDTQVRLERPDIDAAILAAALTMRGINPGEPSVTITPAARDALQSETFNYDSFSRPRYTLMRLVESKKVPGKVEVGAALSFLDAMMRRTTISLLMSCEWADEGKRIIISQASIQQIVPAQPKTLLLIIPARRVPKDVLTINSHASLLSWLIDNRATSEELMNGSADECYLFALVYDRLAPGDKLSMCVSNSSTGTGCDSGNAVDIDCYQGWHVAVMQGRFDWKGDQPFYIKVIYTPSGSNEKRVILSLSSGLKVVDAYGKPASVPVPVMPGSGKIRIILAIIGILGLLICLLGYRMKRLFWFIAGIAFGSAVAYLVPARFEQPWLLLTIIGTAALIGAVVMAALPCIGRLIWGATIGVAVGTILTKIPIDIVDPIMISAFGICALIALGLPRASTIVISSLIGSLLFAISAGHLLGYYNIAAWTAVSIRSLYETGSNSSLAEWVSNLNDNMQILIVFMLWLFAMGIVIQSFTGGRQKRKPASKVQQVTDDNNSDGL